MAGPSNFRDTAPDPSMRHDGLPRLMLPGDHVCQQIPCTKAKCATHQCCVRVVCVCGGEKNPIPLEQAHPNNRSRLSISEPTSASLQRDGQSTLPRLRHLSTTQVSSVLYVPVL